MPLTVTPQDRRTYLVESSRPGIPPHLVDMEFEDNGGKPACDCEGFTMKKTTRCEHIKSVEQFETEHPELKEMKK